MAPPPLADVPQLSDHLQTSLETQQAAAVQALATASATVRGYTRQTISLVEDDEVALRGTWQPDLVLPERPVVEVGDITSTTAGLIASTSWTTAGGIVTRSGGWFGPATSLTVTYSHGFEEIPEDIVGVVLAVAARTFDNPRALASQSYEGQSFSPHLYPLELSRSEQKILDRYRRRTW